jgi:hypothetical protein
MKFILGEVLEYRNADFSGINRPKDARTVSVEGHRIFRRNRIILQCLRERAAVKEKP